MKSKQGYLIASSLLLFESAYIVVLTVGLLTLPTPDSPISDPWFTLMELLILLIAPLLVILLAILHFHPVTTNKLYSLLAIMFMLGLCILTMGLHFSILVLSRQPAFGIPPWSEIIFPFRWPSVAYVIDILAWDIFWPVSVFFMGFSLKNSGTALKIRYFCFVSAGLSALGLLGIPTGNMAFRNIGIIGYVPVFLIILILLIRFFREEIRSRDTSFQE